MVKEKDKAKDKLSGKRQKKYLMAMSNMCTKKLKKILVVLLLFVYFFKSEV